jgi:hypothetical protein
VRGLVCAHIGDALLVGVVSVEILERTELVGRRIITVASWMIASVVLGSKVLATWIESWREPWFLKIGMVLMVEVGRTLFVGVQGKATSFRQDGFMLLIFQ